MNITLHGWEGIFAAFWACLGAGAALAAAYEWLEDRLTRDKWRVTRRWDRPGARVLLPDGREGTVEIVYRDEAPGMAVVIFEDAGPEYAPVASLSPAPVVAS